MPRLDATSLSNSSTESELPLSVEMWQGSLTPFFRYKNYSGRFAHYLTWTDARLRVYLHLTHGIPDDGLPTTRPGLLQETRKRYAGEDLPDDNLDLTDPGFQESDRKDNLVMRILNKLYKDEAKRKKKELAKGRAEDVHKKTEL